MVAEGAGLWAELTQLHASQPIPYSQLVSWNHGDFVFTPEFDDILSMTKARQYGFNDVIDPKGMFLKLFDELRDNLVIL